MKAKYQVHKKRKEDFNLLTSHSYNGCERSNFLVVLQRNHRDNTEGETLIVLKRGEEVLTIDDFRHASEVLYRVTEKMGSDTVRDVKNYCALPTIVGSYLTVEHTKSYIANLRLTYIPANLKAKTYLIYLNLDRPDEVRGISRRRGLFLFRIELNLVYSSEVNIS